jgi:hypothetical protein
MKEGTYKCMPKKAKTISGKINQYNLNRRDLTTEEQNMP